MIWHTQSKEAVLGECRTDPATGLTDAEAADRLLLHRENIWAKRRERSFFRRFLTQVASPAIILLVAAAILTVIVLLIQTKGRIGVRWLEPAILIIMTGITALLGTIQEGRAERSLDSMQLLTGHTARVLRNGEWKTVSPSVLVPGDIVEIKEGDICPADCRLLDTVMLSCDEYILTEDSALSDKSADAEPDSIAPIYKRANMVYAGTAVTGGRATAVVVETGIHTEIGKRNALLLPDDRAYLPLNQKLHDISRLFAIVVAVACAVFFIVGLIRDLPFLDLLLTVVAMAVAIIPEGLTAIATIVLAVGVGRMVKQNIIIRRHVCVDTLGRVSVICTDKTGVLTQNKPVMTSVFVSDKIRYIADTNRPDALALVRLAALCSNGNEDPFEQAILDTAEKLGMNRSLLETDYPRIAELPFDRERKRMTTAHLFGDQTVVIVKGAPEKVLGLCDNVDMDRVAEAYVEMGNRGQRVLAVAYKAVESNADFTVAELENELSFAGLIGLEDPVCPQATAALKECRSAGIIPIIVTGDHITTACAVAKTMGILTDDTDAIDGNRLSRMSDEELAANIRRYRVYARISPADKCRIVKAWQQAGETVAVTGKDVTDLAALRQADIGCAFGKSGDDAARGNADLIIGDNRFATLVEAVKGGRSIHRTVERTARYFIGCNGAELLLMLVGLIVFGVTPLVPLLLLWLNLVTDSLPALALGLEPVDRFIMAEKPRTKDEPLLLNRCGIVTLVQAVLLAALAMVAFLLGKADWLGSSTALSTTMCFAVLAIGELVLALVTRSDKPLYKVGLLKNGSLLIAVAASILLILAVLLIPPVRQLFATAAIPAGKWLTLLGFALVPTVVTEGIKILK